MEGNFVNGVVCSLDFLVDNIKKELTKYDANVPENNDQSEDYFYNGRVGIATMIVIGRVLNGIHDNGVLVVSCKGEIETSEPYCECMNKVLEDKYPHIKRMYLRNIEP